MEKTNGPKNVQLVRRPCPTALKVALTALIVFSIAALTALMWLHSAVRAQTEKLRDEASAIGYANSDLEQRIHDPDSVENVKKAAEEALGLVDPDAVIIDPN